jgi:predicted ferric reductase
MEGSHRPDGASTEARTVSAGPPPTGLPPLVLVGLYIGLGLLPLVVAALQGLAARDFWRELASGLAMVGFAMMLVQFLLSGRFRQISGHAGIDLTMRFHQLAAWSVLTFIVLHPFLYAVPRLWPDPAEALASLGGMFGSPGLRTGVVAWWLLILLVLMGVWRDRLPFRYELWRLSHGLGAALVAGLSAHHTLSVGTYSAAPLLAGFWATLAAIALASLLYVYALKPALQRREPYRVTLNEKAAERMWRVAVEPVKERALDFAAGQFVWLNLGHSPFSLTEHPFSISSAPADRPRIEFTIKEVGDFTQRIGQVPVGTTAYLDGPHGNFTPAGRSASRIVLIGGGVGFAPIMGILRQLKAESWPHPVDVIYGNRSEAQILYRYELEEMREALDLTLHLVLSEPPEAWAGPTGELTPDVLRRCLPALDPAALYFVCGPVPMMDAAERALLDFGVPARRIISERFTYA